MRGGGGGKWFILYQSDIYYSIWTNDMIPFFYLFHISGAGKHLRAKELKLKMSGGGKSCSQECLWVENSWCSKSHFGKYLAVESTLRWKMFGFPKSCNHCQKVKKNITYNLFNYYHLFLVQKDLDKRHEYIHTFALN